MTMRKSITEEVRLFKILSREMNRIGGQAADLYAAACNHELRAYLENNQPHVSHDVWDAAIELADIREPICIK